MSLEFERQEVSEEVFLRVLGEATGALRQESIDHAIMGGLGSAAFGRARWTLDVDLFVRPQDARRALEALAANGFEPHQTKHNWLHKAVKEQVLVDLIFTAKGGIYLDDDMLARVRTVEFRGVELPVVPPEDLIVMKAIAHDQDTPRYWHDALGIIAHADLDWDYLVRRARVGPRRVLSLLLHAQSDDLVVPDTAVRQLFRWIYKRAA
jgi:predicted nucleotidyltransferase